MARRRSKVQTSSQLIPVLALLLVFDLLAGAGVAGVVILALEIGIVLYAISSGDETLIVLAACVLVFGLAVRLGFGLGDLFGRPSRHSTATPARVKETVASDVAQMYLALAERRCPEQLTRAAEAQVVQAFLRTSRPSAAACAEAVARVGPAGFGLRGETEQQAAARVALSSGGRARYTTVSGIVFNWRCTEGRLESCVVSGLEGGPFPTTS